MIKFIDMCTPNEARNKGLHSMFPDDIWGICVHNTANSASAMDEIRYMQRRDDDTCFHFAVDEDTVVQGISTELNTWHAGDGVNGAGNNHYISIEICRSTCYNGLYDAAEDNAAQFIAYLLHTQTHWNSSKITFHNDFSGKWCPHRILDKDKGVSFMKQIKEYKSIYDEIDGLQKEFLNLKSSVDVYFDECYNTLDKVDNKFDYILEIVNRCGKVIYSSFEDLPENTKHLFSYLFDNEIMYGEGDEKINLTYSEYRMALMLARAMKQLDSK